MKKFLMVAYHFPPQTGSSGMLRSVKFCRYLPEFGWDPIVLSVHPRAYEQVNEARLSEIPANTEVHRTFALDARRQLSFKGRFIGATALPDRWSSWVLCAIPKGLSLLKRRKLELIYTTYPIASALLIGYILHKLTGKPWVADLRDSITEDYYPRERNVWRAYRWIESKVAKYATKIVVTAESTRRMYLERYPKLDPDRCIVILNGFDEEDFRDLPRATLPDGSRPLRLVHGGVLYPQDRDPRPFFAAISRMVREGILCGKDVQVELRAPGTEQYYQQLIADYKISSVIKLMPLIGYRESLEDAALSDGFLVFQGPSCNHQIPAKVYEYLRLGKPMFALTDHAGDTAQLLRDNNGASIVDITNESAIYGAFQKFLGLVHAGRHPVPDQEQVKRYTRRSQAGRMARVLSEAIGLMPDQPKPSGGLPVREAVSSSK